MILGLLGAALMVAACQGKGRELTQEERSAVMGKAGATEVASGDRAKVVASVGKRSITVGDITDEINEQNPYIRMRYSSLEQKKKFLQNMIQFEVLAQEAERKKLDRDPEVLRRYKRAMVNTLLTQLRETLVKMEDITEADIKKYYDEKSDLYRQPEKVRVSMVLVKDEKDAKDVLSRARAKPEDAGAFAELVQAHSVHQASRARAGDLDFFAADNKDLPAPVVAAAFKIEKMWALAGPVKTDEGWAVLMKTGHRAPIIKPFEREKEQIKNRIYNERRSQAILDFVKGLETRAQVKINDKNLGLVRPKMEPGKPPAPQHAH